MTEAIVTKNAIEIWKFAKKKEKKIEGVSRKNIYRRFTAILITSLWLLVR